MLATTLDYPCIVDTLAFQPAFIAANPEAVKRVVKSWFDAVEMIGREPDKSFEIMGKRVKQSAEAFKASAGFIEWMDAARNKDYVAKGLPEFQQKAQLVQRETGVVRQDVDLSKLLDTRFVA